MHSYRLVYEKSVGVTEHKKSAIAEKESKRTSSGRGAKKNQ